MKQVLLLLATAIILPAAACKKTQTQTVTVVRDCTGTYLRFDGKDYHVCNPEKVASYLNGATVRAAFSRLSDCNGSAKGAIVCEMLHLNEGWIEVRQVK